MKKLLLSLATVALGLFSANADTVTFDMANTKGLNGVPTSSSASAATWTLDGYDFESTYAYNSNYAYLMIANNGTLKLPVINDVVTSIEITTTSGMSTSASLSLYADSTTGTALASGIGSNTTKTISIENGAANTAYYLTNTSGKNAQLKSVTITYGEGGGTTDPEPDPTPGEGGDTITEELTVKSFTSSTSTSYATYTFESSLTGITYSAMMSTNSGKSIQLRTTNSNEGLVTTKNPNGLTLKSVSIEYNSSTNNARISDLYGKEGNYTSPANLFSSNDAGTKFGTIPMSNPATVNTNAGYTGFGVRSNNSALYIDKLILVWEKQSGGLQLPEISFPQNNYTVALGEDFTSPVATAKSNGKIAYSSSKTEVASVNETTGVLEIKAVGSTTITATIAATDTYKEGSAQYILTVTPNGTITVAQALAYIEDGYNGEATVKGYITAITEMSNTDSGSTYGNATYFIADEEEGDPTLEIYRGYWMNGDKFETGEEIEVGGLITVTGTILNYNGTPEFTTGSKVVAYEPPVIPEDQVAAPTFDPNGGIIAKDSQITISCETEGATIVYTINDGDIIEALAPVTLTISEDTEIVAYATKEKMTDSKTITVNYTVFDENQTEAKFDFTNEAWLKGEGISLPTTASTGTNIAGKSFTESIVTIAFAENSESNQARIWKQTGDKGLQLRVYTTDKFTISVPEGKCIEKISFANVSGNNALSLADDCKNEGTLVSNGATATWTPGVSEIQALSLDDHGNVNSVTFIPEKTTYINSITVDYNISTGIDGIEAEDAAPIYYNLQGVRVANPEKGLYIVVKGNKAEKVIF